MMLRKTNEQQESKKATGWKALCAALATTLVLGGGFAAARFTNLKSNAAPMYSADGVKLADYSIEKINDGSGRYILHVEALNDEFNIIACEISCDPGFNSSEVFTFGALAQDGATSYTNEVVTLEPGTTLYLRTTDADGFKQVYTINVPAEDEPNEGVVVKEIDEDEPVVKDRKKQKDNSAVPARESEATSTPTPAPVTGNAVPATPVAKTPVTPSSKKMVVKKAVVLGQKAFVDIKDADETEVKDTEKKNKKETNQKETNETIKNSVTVNKVTENITETTEISQKKEAVLMVSYVSVNGKSLAATESFPGMIGQAFSVNAKEIAGYNLVSTVGRTSGQYTKNVEQTIFVYEKIQDTEDKEDEDLVLSKQKGFVYVSYVTENGKKLAASEISGTEGSDYTVEEKAFEGYTLISVKGEKNGIINGTKEVVFIYAENAPVEPVEPSEPSEPHEHVFVIIRSGEASCETEGFIEYGCECGETKSEVVAPVGHDYEVTMTETSIIEKCKNCGKENVVNADSNTDNDADSDTNNDTNNDADDSVNNADETVNETVDETVNDTADEVVDETVDETEETETTEDATDETVDETVDSETVNNAEETESAII